MSDVTEGLAALEKGGRRLLVIAPLEYPLRVDYDWANPVSQQTYWLAKHLERKYRDVAVVCPVGSSPDFKDMIQTNSTDERGAFGEYRELVKWDEYELIIDFSFEKWSYQMAKEKKVKTLYVLHPTFHEYKQPPPLRYPCFTGVSDAHCQLVSQELGLPVRELPFGYELPPSPPARDDKGYLLYFGRIVKERGVHELIDLCKKRRLELVIAGDDRYVDQGYVHRVLGESDGELIRYMGAVGENVKLRLLAEARALVIPYLNDFDAYALLTAKAATALRVPTIMFEKGAANEFFREWKGYGLSRVTLDALRTSISAPFEGTIPRFEEDNGARPSYERFESLISEAVSAPW